ncbi:hypothetical protein [Pareuzebyella sediminis]|uniref:hypothetical protein n=1 Tax=Pareuzebyella sediminis TaxID=2607998 RepID=UPI0011ED8185|nr:hypothetical protein [Pareuzebyella sediminis]
MKESYSGKHEAFIDQLMNNKFILIKYHHFIVQKTKNPIKLNLDPEIIKFYEEIESLKIAWTCNLNNIELHFLDEELDFVEGEFNVLDKTALLNGLDEAMLENEFCLKISPKYAGKLFPFEEIKDEFVICVNIENRNEVIYLDLVAGEQFNIPIGFKEYLKCGYENYFFYGWQKGVLLKSNVHLKRLQHYLPQIIPNKNLKI